MIDPKYKVGASVEADTPWDGFVAGTIKEIEVVYTVELTSPRGRLYKRTEDQIRDPRPSPEEAWEKATMTIAFRSSERRGWNYSSTAIDEFNKETRHQVYQILGSAGIKIEPEVKADVRRLIGIADGM